MKTIEQKTSRALCVAVTLAIPRHLRASFGVRSGAQGTAIVDYMITHASSEQRRNDCHDTRVALESECYRIAESYGAMTVFPPHVTEYTEPEGDHCAGQHGCGAATPAQCRCQDEE